MGNYLNLLIFYIWYDNVIYIPNIKFKRRNEKGNMNLIIHSFNEESVRKEEIGEWAWEMENACRDGDLEKVKSLLSKEVSENNPSHVYNICSIQNRAFEYACCYGHVDIVNYLLTNSNLTYHVDIHMGDDIGLRSASECIQLEMVKYLLTSPNLIEHAHIHADDDGAFKGACYNDDNELINYFIIDFQIKRTDAINIFIKNASEIISMFDKRELLINLENDLEINSSKKRKKI